MENRIIGAVMPFIVSAAFCFPWKVTEANTAVSSTRVSTENRNDTLSKYAAIANDSSKITANFNGKSVKAGCTRNSCSLYADVDKSQQKMDVYVSGELLYTFPVSTGKTGHPTPDMDLRPQGPLYVKYTSSKFPEGDYEGLGNMPYVVFLKDGYAIHGTTPGSIRKLGSKASHGCVRLHPDDARTFYELVKSYGLPNTWVSVHQ
jgi:lipoprotein-anchoring transpeptidase ErfK/SrfK